MELTFLIGTYRMLSNTYLYNGHQLLVGGPHHLSRLLAAPSENTLHTCDPHPIDHVPCQMERHRLWCGECLSLLEGHAQIDVDKLRGVGVDEDFLNVTVSQSYKVANWRQNRSMLRLLPSPFLPLPPSLSFLPLLSLPFLPHMYCKPH